MKRKIGLMRMQPPIVVLMTSLCLALRPYETGGSQDMEMTEIFNSEGVYIGRTELKEAIRRRFSRDRLYALYEKESGCQQLVVSRMI